MKFQIVFLLTSSLVFNVTAVSTNTRTLFGTLLVGSALAASVYGDYTFSEFELALLTTAALILTFPRPSANSCTAPGYTDDPLMGCYRIYAADASFTHSDAVNLCAGDGGRLALINSEAEARAFTEKLKEKFDNDPNKLQGAYIQGQRQTFGAPWTDDSGTPLPYLPTVDNSANPTYLKLVLYVLAVSPLFAAIPDIGFGLPFPVLCEI